MSINNVIADNFAPATYLTYITHRFGAEVLREEISSTAEHHISNYAGRARISEKVARLNIRRAFAVLRPEHLANHQATIEEALTLIAEGYPVTLRDVVRTSPSSLAQLIRCLEDNAPAPKNPRKVKEGFRLLRELIEAAQ